MDDEERKDFLKCNVCIVKCMRRCGLEMHVEAVHELLWDWSGEGFAQL